MQGTLDCATPLCACVLVCLSVMLILAPNTLWCSSMLHIKIQVFAPVSKVSCVKHVSCPPFVRLVRMSL